MGERPSHIGTPSCCVGFGWSWTGRRKAGAALSVPGCGKGFLPRQPLPQPQRAGLEVMGSLALRSVPSFSCGRASEEVKRAAALTLLLPAWARGPPASWLGASGADTCQVRSLSVPEQDWLARSPPTPPYSLPGALPHPRLPGTHLCPAVPDLPPTPTFHALGGLRVELGLVPPSQGVSGARGGGAPGGTVSTATGLGLGSPRHAPSPTHCPLSAVCLYPTRPMQ